MKGWKKWEFWKRLRDFCNKKMTDAWMEGPTGRGNCDSGCPKCKQWESHGNVIRTTDGGDGTELRKRESCGHEWKAIFTPAGFIPLDEFKHPDNDDNKA